MQNEKKAYEAPKLIVHGNIAELTQSNSKVPTQLDADFPTGTPFEELTFDGPLS